MSCGADARTGARLCGAARRAAWVVVVACLTTAQSAMGAPTVGDWTGAQVGAAATRAQAALVSELRARPQDAAAHLKYGRLLGREFLERRTADWRPAVAAYEFALQLEPALPTARAELARIYAAAGRSDVASQLLSEHVALRPNDTSALAELATVSLQRPDLTLAVWAARTAAGLRQDRTSLAAAALATGAAGTPDGPGFLERLRAVDPTAAIKVEADIAVWASAADLAREANAAQPSPVGPPAGAAPAAGPGPDGGAAPPPLGAAPAGRSARGDWRACESAQAAPVSSYNSGFGASATPVLGPQPQAGLPAPCAGAGGPPMAVIEAVIVRQSDEAAEIRGVNLLSALQLVATGRLRVVEETFEGAPPQNTNFLTLSLPQNGIPYLLDILDDQGARADVLAKPSLAALDRTASVFFSGATITIPVQGQYSGSLQEKSIGVSLAVTPTFVTDDDVLLAVTAGRSFLEESLEAQLDQGIQTTNNTVTANVRLKMGETLVLSGLVEREDTADSTEVPVLGRVPGVGLFFSSRDTRILRNNLIILLTLRRPNEADTERSAGDSLLPARYDRRLGDALRERARARTPEAETLTELSRRLVAIGMKGRLPVSLAVGPKD